MTSDSYYICTILCPRFLLPSFPMRKTCSQTGERNKNFGGSTWGIAPVFKSNTQLYKNNSVAINDIIYLINRCFDPKLLSYIGIKQLQLFYGGFELKIKSTRMITLKNCATCPEYLWMEKMDSFIFISSVINDEVSIKKS